jgi:membrane-associated protease RseP (regulator of RpoE activity)
MSGPKHLWSGDWEDESARAAARRGYEVLPEPEPEPDPPEPEPELTDPDNRTPMVRYAGVILALVLVVAVVLAATLGGSTNKPHRTGTSTVASTQTGTGPNGGAAIQGNRVISPTVNLPTGNWLGMQIVSSSSGAVVSNVQISSPGDNAGFEPGDQIDAINGKEIGSVSQIRAVTADLPLGSVLSIQIERGSTQITLVLTMRKRPTITP